VQLGTIAPGTAVPDKTAAASRREGRSSAAVDGRRAADAVGETSMAPQSGSPPWLEGGWDTLDTTSHSAWLLQMLQGRLDSWGRRLAQSSHSCTTPVRQTGPAS
jgi:hypothetical protein